nr:unnamed protein product [Spirometra erinaceieuropaei]
MTTTKAPFLFDPLKVHTAVTGWQLRLESEGTLLLPQPAPTGLDLEDLSVLFLRLNQQLPGDVGRFSIFFFNYVKLRPGEAIFLRVSSCALHGLLSSLELSAHLSQQSACLSDCIRSANG